MSEQPPRRKSLRLRGFNYRSPALYHVVLVTNHWTCRFGRVEDDEIILNPIGRMVADVWEEIPSAFPDVSLDAWIVMPNHIHGIVFIEPHEHDVLGTELGKVVQWFKSVTTVRYGHGVAARRWPRYDRRLWHRNYYDHIVRGERDLEALQLYIEANPANWVKDKLHFDE